MKIEGVRTGRWSALRQRFITEQPNIQQVPMPRDYDPWVRQAMRQWFEDLPRKEPPKLEEPSVPW